MLDKLLGGGNHSDVIPHSLPTLGEEENRVLSELLQSRQIADGPQIGYFEQTMAAFHHRHGGVATSSGFTALHLSLLVLGVGRGDEVILPTTQTCLAIVNAIQLVHATPISVDSNLEDMNLSVAAVAKAITPRTKAIIVPHYLGIPSDMTLLEGLGVPIIEDCAQAIGATYHDKLVGSFGDLAVFSFYATKMMTTIDGGMVLCDRSDWLDQMRDLRYYAGKTTPQPVRYNYKLQNLHAALGLAQIEKLPSFVQRRREIAELYDLTLDPALGKKLVYDTSDKRACYYRYVVQMRSEVHRDEMIHALQDQGIGAGKNFFLLHHELEQNGVFENAERLARTELSLPIYPELTAEDLDRITTTVNSLAREILS